MSARLWLVVILGMLVLVLGAWAYQRLNSQFEVHVSNPETSVPIAGARVMVIRQQGTTDFSGIVRFRLVTKGYARVSVTKTGYTSETLLAKIRIPKTHLDVQIKPQAQLLRLKIMYPQDQARVPAQFSFSGYAEHLPENMSLWILVTPKHSERTMPVPIALIPTSNGVSLNCPITLKRLRHAYTLAVVALPVHLNDEWTKANQRKNGSLRPEQMREAIPLRRLTVQAVPQKR